MRCIVEILESAAPLTPGFSIRIQNPPWQDLVLADVERRGPNGSPILWVAYCESHGTAGFPEMTFEVERFGELMKITPLSLRRDMTSEVEHCAMEIASEWVVVWPIQRIHADVAMRWDKQLLARGYVAAFKKGKAKELGKGSSAGRSLVPIGRRIYRAMEEWIRKAFPSSSV